MISIAMCTYNGELFIKEQIDSILNQTYCDFELVITDDGSSDKTINIVKEYQLLDNRIKFFQNKTNLGFVKNFEKAISLCTGEYIALADQDDIWKINKLEIFLDEIKDNVLIYSDAILVDKYSNSIGSELIRSNKKKLVSGSCNKSFLLSNCVSGNTLMFKKELVKYILPIPKGISFHDIWIAFVSSTYGTITYTEESMTYYRRYSEQITKTREKSYNSFFDRLKQKEKIRIHDATAIVKDLNIFKSLKILKDSNVIEIIDELVNHYSNYSNIYFSNKLEKILKRHKDEVFAIFKDKYRNKRIRRTTIGLKLHKLTCFVL